MNELDSEWKWFKGEAEKTSDQWKELVSHLQDNPYSSIVDLEDDPFELKKYCWQRLWRGDEYLVYFEVDTRL